MKYLRLFLLLFLSFPAFAQQKPPGYYSSVLSKYNYHGWEIRKGDRLALQDNDTLVVKEIQKYEQRSGNAYYLVGQNRTGQTQYYDPAFAVPAGLIKVPDHIVLDHLEKEAYGELPLEEGRIVYERIGTVNGASVPQLYDRAMSHFARVFAQTKDAIQVQDKELGHIIVNNNFKIPYAQDGSGSLFVSYLCEVALKEGKYRLRLYDFNLTNELGQPAFMEAMTLSRIRKHADAAAQFDRNNLAFVASLGQALEKAPDTDW